MDQFKDNILMLIIENKFNFNENLFHFHRALPAYSSNRISRFTVFGTIEMIKGSSLKLENRIRY